MTFEEFQASGRDVADVSSYAGDCDPRPGRVYYGDCYIEDAGAPWREGKWMLVIERGSWISDDLAKLERTLYDWAKQEGYFDAR